MFMLWLACASSPTVPTPTVEPLRLSIFHHHRRLDGTELNTQYVSHAWYGNAGHQIMTVEWDEKSLPTIYDWNDVLTLELDPSDLWTVERVAMDVEVTSDVWLSQGCAGYSLVSHSDQEVGLYEAPDHTGQCFAYLGHTPAPMPELVPVGQARHSWSGASPG